jgi:hypothetical protein
MAARAGQCPGGRICAGDRAEAEGAEGAQRKKKEKRNQGLIWKSWKVQGFFRKLKILTDPKIK